MPPRPSSSVEERLSLVQLKEADATLAAASRALGFCPAWGEKWWRRYRAGGEAALNPPPPPAPGPLATFAPAVAAAVLALRRGHPLLGARLARLRLADDPALAGQRLPAWRTIHRAWVAAGLVAPRLPRDAPPPPPPPPADPGDPHAVWQIDHQDGLPVRGLSEAVVLQSVRAPAAALVVGADLFPGPRGAHAVPLDDVLDAVRQNMTAWGKPRALSVDGGVHFLGRPQRQFPSRLELFCAGLGVAVVPIRPGRPTDHGAVERQHALCDAVLLGPAYADLAAAQAALDAHVALLNARFPSRARACGGRAPLEAHPAARHSGRPYDPAREWRDFDLKAVDDLLAGWTWHRRVGAKTGQFSFADRNVSVGKAWAGQAVTLRFDPKDRQVVVYAPGTRPKEVGPELKRFHCAAFDKETILGDSRVAWRPLPAAPPRSDDTAPAREGLRPCGT
jgi:transposase-like protein